MRTKTALLTIAALAAGLAGASAQVYSQNIVGYVNVVTQPVANRFALVANPLDNGSNTIVSLFGTVSNQTQISIWNGTSFDSYTKLAGSWGAGASVLLPPGQGFFIKYPLNMGVVTNTFVGNVLIESPGASGGTNTIALPTTLVCLGAKLPVAGTILDSGNGTLNLGTVLPNQSTFQTWNGTSFDSYTKLAGSWGAGTNVVFDLGKGFFVKAKVATNWVQVLP